MKQGNLWYNMSTLNKALEASTREAHTYKAACLDEPAKMCSCLQIEWMWIVFESGGMNWMELSYVENSIESNFPIQINWTATV